MKNTLLLQVKSVHQTGELQSVAWFGDWPGTLTELVPALPDNPDLATSLGLFVAASAVLILIAYALTVLAIALSRTWRGRVSQAPASGIRR